MGKHSEDFLPMGYGFLWFSEMLALLHLLMEECLGYFGYVYLLAYCQSVIFNDILWRCIFRFLCAIFGIEFNEGGYRIHGEYWRSEAIAGVVTSQSPPPCSFTWISNSRTAFAMVSFLLIAEAPNLMLQDERTCATISSQLCNEYLSCSCLPFTMRVFFTGVMTRNGTFNGDEIHNSGNPCARPGIHYVMRLLSLGFRFGEALHPGPCDNGEEYTFLITNPTSICQKAQIFKEVIYESGAHFVAVSETSATLAVQRHFTAQMNHLRWKSFFSAPAPPQKERLDHEASLRGRALGVAALSCLPIRNCCDGLPTIWENSLRLIHLVVSLGGVSIQVFVLYGLVAAHAGAMAYNNDLLMAVWSASKALPLPVVILGDFNTDLEKMSSAQFFFEHGFTSLQRKHVELYGNPMPPTCKESTSPDTALISPELAGMINRVQVHDHGLWFDTHHPVSFTLQMPTPPLKRWVLPRPAPLTDFFFTKEQITDAWNSRGHVDPPNSFPDWAFSVEQTFDVALRQLPSGYGLPRKLPNRYKGRCKNVERKARPFSALMKPMRPGEFMPQHEIHSMRTLRITRQLRRIQSLVRHLRKFGQAPTESQAQLLSREWNAIHTMWWDGCRFTWWIQQWPELWPTPADTPTLDWAYTLEQLVRFEVQKLIAADHDAWQLKQRYFQHQDRHHQTSRNAFRAIKGGSPQLTKLTSYTAQEAIAVPKPDFSFVELWCEAPQDFHVHHPLLFADIPCRCLEQQTHFLIVSFGNDDADIPECGTLVQHAHHVEAAEIFEQLNAYWLPLWQRQDPDIQDDHVRQAEFEDFLSHISPYIRDLKVDVHGEAVWIQAVKDLNPRSAAGQDGVLAAELQLLPDQLILQLRDLANSHVDGFPPVIMASRAIPVPKPVDVLTASSVRPITVISQIYRLWSRLVCRQILLQWAQVMPFDLTGLLPRRGAFEAAYQMQWAIESAEFAQVPCGGLTLDLCKCFNMISRQIGETTLLRLGLPKALFSQWKGSLARLSRRWEFSGQSSTSIPASCGFPEGDTFSVLIMICISIVWVAAIHHACGEEPAVSAYADNWTWSSTCAANFQPILKLTMAWTSLAGLVVDWLKTWYWATSQPFAQSLSAALKKIGQPQVKRALAASDLGCPLRYSGNPKLCKLPHRIQVALKRLKRIEVGSYDLDTKVTLINQGVYPTAFYGCEMIPLGLKHFEQMRSAVANALVGTSQCMTPCLITLFASFKLRDPQLHVILSAIAAARRFLHTRSLVTQELFFKCAASFRPKPNQSRGPASTLQDYLSRLGWVLDRHGHIFVTPFLRYHILEIPWAWLQTFADEAWQDRLIAMVTQKHSLGHLPNMSRAMTTQILSRFPTEVRVLALREIAGAYLTRDQQHTWDHTQDDRCPYCDAVDSRWHRLVECAAFHTVREQHQEVIEYVVECDTCWTEAPVLFERPDQVLRQSILHRIPEAGFSETVKLQIEDLLSTCEFIPFFTDGSCHRPSQPMFRYAAYSIVLDSAVSDFEREHEVQQFHLTGNLPSTLHLLAQAGCTGEQSVNRAELFAIVRIVETFPFAVIFSDSSYAQQAFLKALHFLPQQFHGLPNLDLLLRLRRVPWLSTCQVHKTKAHRNLSMLEGVDCYHALGNEVADRGAKSAFESLYPALVQDWEGMYQEETAHAAMYAKFITYLAALQKVRVRLHRRDPLDTKETRAPCSAKDFREQLREWLPTPTWMPQTGEKNLEAFWRHSVWGPAIGIQVGAWLSQCTWLAPDNQHDIADIGMSWMEVAIALCLWLQMVLPVRRKDALGGFYFVCATTFAEAQALGITLSELALQTSTLVSQLVSLTPLDLLPPYVARRRVRAPLALGFGSNSYGWSSRPSIPNQTAVWNILDNLRKSHLGATSWAFLPTGFSSLSFCEWDDRSTTWSARLERLSKGKKARQEMNGNV